jgi:aquaporin Z
MESVCLGLFMLSASVCTILLEYPGSAIHQALPGNFIRLVIMGVSMGLTATLIIYSPMGKLSGAHMNPAVTLAFYWLGKIKREDAVAYILFQIIVGVLVVYLVALCFGAAFSELPVNYIVTTPGLTGVWTALLFETIMSFVMMSTVLYVTNHLKISKYTGVIAGIIVAVFLVSSAQISGFSINPARTLASALPARQYESLWIYLIAPFLGMLSAAAFFRFRKRNALCAKMHHHHDYPCIFNCDYCTHKSAQES